MPDSYREQEERVVQAVDYYREDPQRTISHAAFLFDVPVGRVQRRLQGIQSRSHGGGQNKTLTAEQERSLCHWIERLDDIGISLCLPALAASANNILKRASTVHPGQSPYPIWSSLSHPGHSARQSETLSEWDRGQDCPRACRGQKKALACCDHCRTLRKAYDSIPFRCNKDLKRLFKKNLGPPMENLNTRQIHIPADRGTFESESRAIRGAFKGPLLSPYPAPDIKNRVQFVLLRKTGPNSAFPAVRMC
jgi:hypothetical protein